MQNTSELGGLLGAVGRHRAMVVSAVLLSTMAGYHVASMLQPIYRASATMYLSMPGYDSVFGGALPVGATDAARGEHEPRPTLPDDDLVQVAPVPVVGYITVAVPHRPVGPPLEAVVRSNGVQTVPSSVLREEVAR